MKTLASCREAMACWDQGIVELFRSDRRLVPELLCAATRRYAPGIIGGLRPGTMAGPIRFASLAAFSGKAAKQKDAADSPKPQPAAPSRTPDGHDHDKFSRLAYEVDVAPALLHQPPVDGAPSLRLVDHTQHGGRFDVLDHVLELIEKNRSR